MTTTAFTPDQMPALDAELDAILSDQPADISSWWKTLARAKAIHISGINTTDPCGISARVGAVQIARHLKQVARKVWGIPLAFLVRGGKVNPELEIEMEAAMHYADHLDGEWTRLMMEQERGRLAALRAQVGDSDLADI